MTIHDSHPFAEPEGSREPGRRLRGRLTGTVSLWTTGEDGARAGLTVSSWLVVAGEQTRVVGFVDPDSDLALALEPASSGSVSSGAPTAVVSVLTWPQRGLADAFAGTVPAPGGPFAQAAFEQTGWGPRPTASTTWVGVRVESAASVGWSTQVTAVVESVTLGDDEPLTHVRGRYRRPADGGVSP